MDGQWHDLDLSGIVPSGAVLVLLRVTLRNSSGGTNSIFLRRDGASNAANVAAVRRHGDGSVVAAADVLVALNAETIEYTINAGQVELVVGGWWK